MPTVRPRTTLYLWEFLLQLLDGKEPCSAISWINRDKGEFVLKDQGEIAKLWGIVKGRPRMDKIKLGRAMRYYYKKKLLAKVPRRKAVYRFVKFNLLEQKQPQMTHEEFPEIDFSDSRILELIDDENTEDGALQQMNMNVNVNDESDTPLESLLADRQEPVFRDQKCQKLFPMETNMFQKKNTSNICNTFIDYSSSVNNDSPYRHDTFNEIKSEPAEKVDSLRSSPSHTVDEDNAELTNPCGTDYLTSLLVQSILINEEQAIQEAMESKRSCMFQQPKYEWVEGTLKPDIQTSYAVKNEPVNYPMLPPYYQNDFSVDSTWTALEEFEKVNMMNKRLSV